MPVRRILSAVALMLVITSVTGCGSQELSRSDQAVAESLAAYAITQSDGVWSKREAQCMAVHFVKSAGVPALKEAGLVSERGTAVPAKVTMAQPVAEDFADAVLACIDFADLVTRQIAKARPDLDTASFSACVRKSITKEQAKQRLIAQQTDDTKSAALKATDAALLKCARGASST
ncbi:MAG: hypothetical protein U0R21_00805 [Nocardioidaceae bacterium]